MVRILLVEDSKFLRIATQRALTRAGYVVSTAADGEEALRLVRERTPDMILLDMMLPKISGHDVLKAIKADAVTAQIPVVIISALWQRNQDRLMADGACAFMEKSVMELNGDSAPLLAVLEGIVNKIGLSVGLNVGLSHEDAHERAHEPAPDQDRAMEASKR